MIFLSCAERFGQIMPRAHFAAHVDVVHDYFGRAISRQSHETLQNQLAQVFLIRLCVAIGVGLLAQFLLEFLMAADLSTVLMPGLALRERERLKGCFIGSEEERGAWTGTWSVEGQAWR